MKIKKYLQNYNLSNKRAFVIGGSGQIGSEVVDALVECNANVFVLDTKKLNIKKPNLTYQYFDCNKLNLIERNLNLFVKSFGCPDILINTSYPVIKKPYKNNFSQIKLEDFKNDINFHLLSYCWISKITSDLMVKNKISGKIVMMGSIYGSLGQDTNLYKNTKIRESFSYPIIKGGLVNFTRQMASFYGNKNIRVNIINSGGIYGKSKVTNKKIDNKFLKRYEARVPMKRMGKTSEIASCILFLVSDASSYVTGEVFTVDGGWSII